MNDVKAGADWPEPFRILNPHGKSPILLTCEHASNHIPREYCQLGLPDCELERHIAWDIGAAALTEKLSGLLDATAILSSYSRLLIDLNRPVKAQSSIPERSETTDIPGNVNLSGHERERRISRIFNPYHQALEALIDDKMREGVPLRIASIHSFTPVFKGSGRPWHAGILHDRYRTEAERLVGSLMADGDVLAATNVPYIIDRAEDYTVPVHGEDRGIAAILVEIRQDLLENSSGVEEWAGRLKKALPAAFAI